MLNMQQLDAIVTKFHIRKEKKPQVRFLPPDLTLSITYLQDVTSRDMFSDFCYWVVR